MISRRLLTINRDRLGTVVFVVVCIAIGSWIPRQLTINPTPSLPETLFLLRKKIPSSEIRVGDVVRFRYADKVTGGSVHLLKRVGCSAGEALLVTDSKEYYCGGRYLGRAKDRSLRGEVLSHFVWNGPVPSGKFFALADHKDSYDSRYFGFIGLDIVEAKAYPIF